jgi:uncharacterized protein (DUF302 family)
MSKVFEAFSVTTKNTNFKEVLEKAETIVKSHKFGILAKFDVKQTLKDKINVDTCSRFIFGICNPSIAHQILEKDSNFLCYAPCSLAFEQKNENEGIHIMIANPMYSVAPNLKEETHETLQKATDEIEKLFSDLKDL